MIARYFRLTNSGHVTAITVAPAYRRLGLANMMMQLLEKVSEQAQCYFVDLYVRMSNESKYTGWSMLLVNTIGTEYILTLVNSTHRF